MSEAVLVPAAPVTTATLPPSARPCMARTASAIHSIFIPAAWRPPSTR